MLADFVAVIVVILGLECVLPNMAADVEGPAGIMKLSMSQVTICSGLTMNW